MTTPPIPLTPSQVEGPYYPLGYKTHENNNLIEDTASLEQAILVRGVVQNPLGEPLQNVLVEIWQADHHGHYHHPHAPHQSTSLDPSFKYWGQDITDEQGNYSFKTVTPAPYDDGGELRTPHIHFKIYVKRGRAALTTQMYFAGHELNGQDIHLQTLLPDEKQLLIVHPIPSTDEQLSKEYVFSITLPR